MGRMIEGNSWKVWCGDGTKIALKDKSIDLMYTANVMEQLSPQIPKMIKEIARVSKYVASFEPGYEYQTSIFGKIHNLQMIILEILELNGGCRYRDNI